MSQAAATSRTRLAEILDEEGRKQKWLAEQLGVSNQLVSQWVNGLHCPQDRRAAIAQVLRREIDDVFPGAS